MDKTTRKILEVLTEMSSVLATKADLDGLATKEDVADIRRNMATKEDMHSIQEQVNNHTRQNGRQDSNRA